MKMQGGDSPNNVFPLRDVEAQYQVVVQNATRDPLGSLSHSQLMREAYPGAVYYHITRPYRVVKVTHRDRTVSVRPEKRYFTKPTHLPTQVYPNLSEGNIYGAGRAGQLTAIECNLQVREVLCGFSERRGSNEFAVAYPTNSALTGVFFDLPHFTRNFFTTGVIISHPALEMLGIKMDRIAGLLYEAFVSLIPFERRDVSFAYDKHRQAWGPVSEGCRFVAIYDQTYGSLRLSGALMGEGVMTRVIEHSIELALLSDTEEPANIDALEAMARAAKEPISNLTVELQGQSMPRQHDGLIRVIKPGSKGWSTVRANEEFFVESVFFRPDGLAYRGRYQDTLTENTIILPVESVLEIPGETIMGFFNSQAGEMVE